MINLTFGEIKRLYARRAVRLLAILLVVGALVTGGWYFFTTFERSKDTDRIGRLSRTKLQEQFDFCMRAPFSEIEPEFDPSMPPEVREQIRKQFEYAPSRRECMQQINGLFSLGRFGKFLYFPRALAQSLRWLSFGGFLLALFLGSSYAGADWTSGWMKTFLTWEARRVRVILAKALATVLGLIGLYVFYEILIAAALAITTAIHGSFVGFDAVVIEDVLESTWRGLYLTAIGGLIGFSLTMIATYTVGAPLAVAIFIVAEAILHGYYVWLRGWSLTSSIIVAGTGYDVNLTVPVGRALWLPGVVSLAVLLIATVTFTRRDVTG